MNNREAPSKRTTFFVGKGFAILRAVFPTGILGLTCRRQGDNEIL